MRAAVQIRRSIVVVAFALPLLVVGCRVGEEQRLFGDLKKHLPEGTRLEVVKAPATPGTVDASPEDYVIHGALTLPNSVRFLFKADRPPDDFHDFRWLYDHAFDDDATLLAFGDWASREVPRGASVYSVIRLFNDVDFKSGKAPKEPAVYDAVMTGRRLLGVPSEQCYAVSVASKSRFSTEWLVRFDPKRRKWTTLVERPDLDRALFGVLGPVADGRRRLEDVTSEDFLDFDARMPGEK